MTTKIDLELYEDDDEATARQDRARSDADLEVGDLKWLMSNKRGRRFIYRLLESAGVWRTSFNTNALVMSFNEGARNQGLKLVAQLTEHCPERYNEMIAEHNNG